MRPKNKKHNFSRTDNKKYQEQNHKKEKTNNNKTIIVAFLSHSRPLYSSHTTHHPTHNTHQKITQKGITKQILFIYGVIL